MTVPSGNTLTDTSAWLGSASGGTGTATINGGGKWANGGAAANFLYVGGSGVGYLYIQPGGTVTCLI